LLFLSLFILYSNKGGGGGGGGGEKGGGVKGKVRVWCLI
jgi:hypothetical protein